MINSHVFGWTVSSNSKFEWSAFCGGTKRRLQTSRREVTLCEEWIGGHGPKQMPSYLFWQSSPWYIICMCGQRVSPIRIRFFQTRISPYVGFLTRLWLWDKLSWGFCVVFSLAAASSWMSGLWDLHPKSYWRIWEEDGVQGSHLLRCKISGGTCEPKKTTFFGVKIQLPRHLLS